MTVVNYFPSLNQLEYVSVNNLENVELFINQFTIWVF